MNMNPKNWRTWFALPKEGHVPYTMLAIAGFLGGLIILGFHFPESFGKSAKASASLLWYIAGMAFFCRKGKEDDYCRWFFLILAAMLGGTVLIVLSRYLPRFL